LKGEGFGDFWLKTPSNWVYCLEKTQKEKGGGKGFAGKRNEREGYYRRSRAVLHKSPPFGCGFQVLMEDRKGNEGQGDLKKGGWVPSLHGVFFKRMWRRKNQGGKIAKRDATEAIDSVVGSLVAIKRLAGERMKKRGVFQKTKIQTGKRKLCRVGKMSDGNSQSKDKPCKGGKRKRPPGKQNEQPKKCRSFP